MKAPVFAYVAPQSLDELIRLLGEPAETAILAGGQSLMPLLALRRVRPERVIDINGLTRELGAVGGDGATLRLGALVRQRTAERDPLIAVRCPLLAEAMPLCGRPATRTRGTVVGSLAHADPAGEIPTVALALDAVVTAVGPAGTRRVAVGDFLTGRHTTALRPDELATDVELPELPAGTGTSFLEVSRRFADRPVVAVAAAVTLDGGVIADARVAIANVAERPVRALRAEAALRGQAPTPEAVSAAAADAVRDLEPASDVHASAAYRRHVAGVLTRRTLTTAVERAR